VAEPPGTFAGLLRRLRTQAGLTQEELAEAASLSPRSVSDLERGVNLTARKETARLLADALSLTGQARAEFEAVARGRSPARETEPASATTATRTLPRDIVSFTGRERELQDLVTAAAKASDSGGVVAIHAIGGMAGVGKTAFAVRAAHRLAPQFPAGQIFLPLHGHTPGQRPVEPVDALASLLLTAGVPTQQIPPGLEARMALWRDRMAGKQLLLVLDDAAGSDQVQPLLPGAGGSLVLVTSRRHLSALESSRAISLDILPADQAAALLVRLAARPELDTRDAAVAELARLCGYLPLALGMLARQLHHHPVWTAADLTADLEAARSRLELMTTENLSVAAAFDLSYQDLSGEQQRMFRRLGLHPGPDIDAYAAAALDDIDLRAARRRLAALYDYYLLAEPGWDRYRMHDLIREHARALADREDPAEDRDRAVGRMLDYYQAAGERAGPHFARYTRPVPDTLDQRRAARPDLSDSVRALGWARAERANLLACLDQATDAGQEARIVALSGALAALLRHDGPWTEAITRHAGAAAAARRGGDRLGEASARYDLGVIWQLTGDNQNAAGELGAALDGYRQLGNRLGEANARFSLGTVRRRTGDHRAAVDDFETALGIYRDIGDRQGQANALNELGIMRFLAGDWPAAIAATDQALAIFRQLGDLKGQASALNTLGATRCTAADYPGAVDAFEEGMGIAQKLADRLGEAHALDNLGVIYNKTGEYQRAGDFHEKALEIMRELGDRLGQGNALNNLGIIRERTGEFDAAAQAQQLALGIFRDLGHRMGQASALSNLGSIWRQTGDYPAAAEALETALGIYREIGNHGDEAEALNGLGTVYRLRGDLDRAIACHQEALDLARSLDSSWNEAHALAGLGRCALAGGGPGDAEATLGQALEIFQRIGAADAAGVSGELAEIAVR